MPLLFDNNSAISFLSGECELDKTAIYENSIVKAEDWAYEKEWRVALPMTDVAKTINTFDFHWRSICGLLRLSHAENAGPAEECGVAGFCGAERKVHG